MAVTIHLAPENGFPFASIRVNPGGLPYLKAIWFRILGSFDAKAAWKTAPEVARP